jgi:uncharacterized protein (TIGR02246 family)
MRTTVLSIILAATWAPVAAAQSATGSHAADETRIRAIVAEQVAAWNVGDENAFSRSFADDGSFTNIRGTVFYGHHSIVDRPREIFTGFFKGSKLAMSVDRIRFAVFLPHQ